jgi:hypothetical protein
MLKGKMEFRLGIEQRVDVMVNPGASEDHEACFHKDAEVFDGAVVKRSYPRFEASSLATASSSLLTALTGSSPNSCSCARSIRARRCRDGESSPHRGLLPRRQVLAVVLNDLGIETGQ